MNDMIERNVGGEKMSKRVLKNWLECSFRKLNNNKEFQGTDLVKEEEKRRVLKEDIYLHNKVYFRFIDAKAVCSNTLKDCCVVPPDGSFQDKWW